MLKSVSLFSRKKTSRPFKDFYTDWIDALKTTHLPLLRHSLSSPSSPAVIAAHVDTIHHHFNCYYAALDLAASNDVAQLLFPSWRNPLEIPFLWLGDLHPYLFTNLLRSYLSQETDESDESFLGFEEIDKNLPGFKEIDANLVVFEFGEKPISERSQKFEGFEFGEKSKKIFDVFEFGEKPISERSRKLVGFEFGEKSKRNLGVFEFGRDSISGYFDRPWDVVMAWKSPSEGLMSKIEQIECGLRLMVPEIMARERSARKVFVEKVGTEWGRSERREVVGEAVEAEMEDLIGVFVDANRLRRSVLADIVSATSVYQGALFLEGLAQFFVGFRDRDLVGEFERCKVPIN